MNERNQLLAAIRQSPEEDMPRLVYADWLDENTESDHDTATAEFIRVSCNNRNRTRKTMPKAAYKWVVNNCERLAGTKAVYLTRTATGKAIEFEYLVEGEHPIPVCIRCSFYRGFIEQIRCWFPRPRTREDMEKCYRLQQSVGMSIFARNPLSVCEPFPLMFPIDDLVANYRDKLAALYREETGREFERIKLNVHPTDTRHHVMEFLLEEIARQESRELLPLLRITREVTPNE